MEHGILSGIIPRANTFLFRCGVSLLVGLSLISLRALPFTWAQEALSAAADAVQEDTDFEEIREFSFVSALLPQVQAVFSLQEAPIRLREPVQAESALGQNSVAYLCGGQEISACADGRVFYAGGDSVWILHENGYQTRYEGLSPSVKAGQQVACGAVIGSAVPSVTLRLSLLQDGRSLDPSMYFADPA